MDPINQNIPTSGGEPEMNTGMTPGQPMGGGAMSQEQMMSNLQDLMSKVEAKYQDFNSAKLTVGNQTEEQKNETLRQLFDMLQAAGIDPNSPEEVQAFLDRVKQADPEMFQRLETALASILGEDDASMVEGPAEEAVEPVAPEMGDMNIQNANPSQNL